MKTIIKISFLILFIIGTFSVNAQIKNDTIWVSTGQSIIIAPGPIKIHSFGNPGYFVDQVVEKYQFIRKNPKNKKNRETTLFITYLDEATNTTKEKFYHVLFTTEKCQQNYEIVPERRRKGTYSENIEEKEEQESKANSTGVRLKNKAESLLDMEDEIGDLGISENYLKCFVKLMRVDENFLFIKNRVINESSLDYNLDLISFQYVREFKRGFLKSKAEKPRDVFPAYKSEIKNIKGFSSESICYAIPLYALQNDETLRIILREKNGRRKININIPAKTIAKSKRL